MSHDQSNHPTERDSSSMATPGSGSAAPGDGLDLDQAAERAADLVSEAINELAKTAQEQGAELIERTEPLRERASDVTDVGIERASEGLDRVAEMMRERAQRGEHVAPQVTLAADWLSQAADYLHDRSTDDLLKDFERFIRNQPVESVAGAIAIGFVLGRMRR